jgi:hypothetical protein
MLPTHRKVYFMPGLAPMENPPSNEAQALLTIEDEPPSGDSMNVLSQPDAAEGEPGCNLPFSERSAE